MMKDLKAKKRVKGKIILESIFVFLIAISPFVYKIHDYFPEDPEATISVFGMTMGNGGFGDISTYVWYLMSKIVPLYLMIFWFMTAKNWWYHIILIPIAMYAFQLFEVVFDSDDHVDTENIWWLLPVCMVVVPIVYFIRIKLYDKYVHGIDLEAMDAELKKLKKTNRTDNDLMMEDEAGHEGVENDMVPKMGYQSFSDYLNATFSTNNIGRLFRNFQDSLKGWLHLKF